MTKHTIEQPGSAEAQALQENWDSDPRWAGTARGYTRWSRATATKP